jgi:hypothetical protein
VGTDSFEGSAVTQTGFIAAMAADLAFAARDVPAAADRRASEWVIVSVWGTNGEFLTLSRTCVAVLSEEAPPGLQPFGTHLGVLLSRAVAETEESSEYLLMRNQPADIPVGGVFFPTDGFVRLSLRDGVSNLTASGLAGSSLAQHDGVAHYDGTLHGQRVAQDAPDLVFGGQDARAWHMTAVRRAWIGEFVPQGRRLVRLARAPRAAPLPSPRSPPLQVLAVAEPALAGPAHSSDSPARIARSVPTSSPDYLALSEPAPHTRRRKRPEAKHGVTTEA